MKERPILFSGPMVRAILDGRKTQARRVVKNAMPEGKDEFFAWFGGELRNAPNGCAPDGLWARGVSGIAHIAPCHFGVPGDRLWVRESFQHTTDARGQGVIVYAADDAAHYLLAEDNGEGDLCGVGAKTDRLRCHPIDQWRPSIHMPRWASRITLEVVSVRVERLQEISDLDLLAEGWPAAAEVARGCEGPEAFPFQGVTRGDLLRGGVENPDTAIEWFAEEWDSMNGNGAWEKNPWVWVVEFKRAEKTS